MNSELIDIKKLTNCIINVIESKYSRNDIFLLFSYCKNISLAFVKIQYNLDKLYFKNVTNDERFFEDFAIDLISPLFSRDDDGRFNEFKKYFKPYISDIFKNNELSLFYLKKLVISKTKQEIIEYFKKEDPSGWKIFRNITEVSKRTENISINQEYGCRYYYLKDDKSQFPADYLPGKPEIETEQLNIWVLKSMQSKKTTTYIIEQLLTRLRNQEEYRQFISRDNIFKALKESMSLTFISLEKEYNAGENQLSLINKEDIIHYISNIIKEKYFVTRKISEKEYQFYKTVAMSYFTDLLNEGTVEKLPYYLNQSSEKYQNNQIHKNRIEYIIKMCKQYLQVYFAEEF